MRVPFSIARWSLATALAAVLTCSDTPRAEAFTIPTSVLFARDGEQANRAPGLACIQEALGGVRAFANVSSLRFFGETKPAVSAGPRSLPGTREIRVVFPDSYKRIDLGQVPGVAGATLGSTIGFDHSLMLSAPRSPDLAQSMRSARLDFARQMWPRFPRSAAGVTVSPRVIREGSRERVALDLAGSDGFQATLLADAVSCVPMALEYSTTTQRPSTMTRVDLSEYREFGGIRFPTVLATSTDGHATVVEHVSRIELNAPDSRQYFAAGR
ncbi:MAG: hypothetical protein ABI634_19440 [Acidobacteriota bacterium]